MNLTFATPPHLQRAVAFGLGLGDEVYEDMRRQLVVASDYMREGLNRGGFAVLASSATHFVNVDLRESGTAVDDVTFCFDLLEKWGVAAVPVSTFYRGCPPTQYVRLCYSKTSRTMDAVFPLLDEALAHWRRKEPA